MKREEIDLRPQRKVGTRETVSGLGNGLEVPFFSNQVHQCKQRRPEIIYHIPLPYHETFFLGVGSPGLVLENHFVCATICLASLNHDFGGSKLVNISAFNDSLEVRPGFLGSWPDIELPTELASFLLFVLPSFLSYELF